MKILFWVINYPNSIGEITNACLFASELEDYDIYFYSVSKLADNYLSYYKFRKISKEELNDTKFDLIIFSEYYTLFSLGPQEPECSEVFEFLKNKNIPLLSLDTLGIGSSKTETERAYELNENIRIYYKKIELPDKNFYSVQPCPLNSPFRNKEKTSYSWLLPGFTKSNSHNIEKLFNFDKNDLNIFLPVSKWKYFQWKKDNKEGDIIEHLKKFFITVFTEHNPEKPVNLFIGVPGPQYKKYSEGNFNLIYFNPDARDYLEPSVYEELIVSMDLVMTINLIQNSFIRALITGIPGINITNNIFKIEKKIPADRQLKEIVINRTYLPGFFPFEKNNPFLQRFITFELTDPELIKHILFFDKYSTGKSNNSFNEYRKICYTAKDIILDIMYSIR